MTLIYAFIFSILTLIPAFAFAADQPNDNPNNHSLFKCNFADPTAEPKYLTLIADAEWSQVVWVSRDHEILPVPQDVIVSLEEVQSTPIAYIWSFNNKHGQPYVQIQETLSEPPRVSILGHKPGTYDCYRQQSANIDYYKRF